MDILKRERDKMAKEREGMSCLKRGSRKSFKVEGGKKKRSYLKKKMDKLKERKYMRPKRERK